MVNLLNNRADACAVETFHCGNCGKDFEAKIITWVDVSRTAHVKRALLTWKFNTIHCAHCGCRHFSGTPFFFEDFSEGLLIAVFPRIPEMRGETEQNIREKYGYYPAQRERVRPRPDTNKKLERKNGNPGLKAQRFGCATGSKQKIAHCGPLPHSV